MNTFDNIRRLAMGSVCALVLGMTAITAHAIPIVGQIDIAGGGKVTGGTDLDDATGLDFNPAGGGTGSFSVVGGTGSFAGQVGGTGTIKDFVFAPFGGTILSFWTLTSGDFSFDLETVVIADQDEDFLNLEGTGTIHGVGFDDTDGDWTLTATNASETVKFAFGSSTFGAPEPATMALIGTGLLALGLGSRRRKRSV